MTLSLNECRMYKLILAKSSDLASKLKSLDQTISPFLARYTELFPNYTDHSVQHSYRMMEHMFDIINNPDSIEVFNLVLCAYAALLHDIGMVVTTEEMLDMLSGKCKPDSDADIVSLIIGLSDDEQKMILRQVIRNVHGQRVAYVLEKLNRNSQLDQYFYLGNTSFRDVVARICSSHQLTCDGLVELIGYETKTIGNYNYNDCYVALLLRLSDALDFSPDRAPKIIYENFNIANDTDSYYHWIRNSGIINDTKVFPRNSHCPLSTNLTGRCSKVEKVIKFIPQKYSDYSELNEDAYLNIQSEVFQYIEWLEAELSESIQVSKIIEKENQDQTDSYLISIAPSVEYPLDKKYTPNFKVKMNYEKIVGLLLGTELYGEKRVGLREIIQNSIDACKFRIAKKSEAGYSPVINIELDYANNCVVIRDNGIGMTEETLKNCFLGIGHSIYNTSSYVLGKTKFDHIGIYGIGFFATFMLSKSVKIRTRYIDSNEELWTSVNDKREYAYIRKVKQNIISPGTEIILEDIYEFSSIFAPRVEGEKNVSEVVRNYLELLFLNDQTGGSNIRFSITTKEAVGSVNIINCDVKSITEKVNSTGAQTLNLTPYLEGIECYVRIGNIQEQRTLFVFEENGTYTSADWSGLPEGKISYCTIRPQNKNPIMLFVLGKNDPFGLFGSSYREKTYYQSSAVFDGSSLTINDFCRANDLHLSYPYGAFIERGKIIRIENTTFLLKENSEFEDSRPKTEHARSGKSYYDYVYARNVLIGEAHLNIRGLLVSINDTFISEIECVVVNVKSERVLPTLKRDNLIKLDMDNISYSIGKALIYSLRDKYFTILQQSIDKLAMVLYGQNNIFMKEEAR